MADDREKKAPEKCACADSLNYGEPAPDCSVCGGSGIVPDRAKIEADRKRAALEAARDAMCPDCKQGREAEDGVHWGHGERENIHCKAAPILKMLEELDG